LNQARTVSRQGCLIGRSTRVRNTNEEDVGLGDFLLLERSRKKCLESAQTGNFMIGITRLNRPWFFSHRRGTDSGYLLGNPAELVDDAENIRVTDNADGLFVLGDDQAPNV